MQACVFVCVCVCQFDNKTLTIVPCWAILIPIHVQCTCMHYTCIIYCSIVGCNGNCWLLSILPQFSVRVCVCVCVCERERERERESACFKKEGCLVVSPITSQDK